MLFCKTIFVVWLRRKSKPCIFYPENLVIILEYNIGICFLHIYWNIYEENRCKFFLYIIISYWSEYSAFVLLCPFIWHPFQDSPDGHETIRSRNDYLAFSCIDWCSGWVYQNLHSWSFLSVPVRWYLRLQRRTKFIARNTWGANMLKKHGFAKLSIERKLEFCRNVLFLSIWVLRETQET